MGDTLVYNSATSATSQETAFANPFAQTHLPTALATSAANSITSLKAAARMTVPQGSPIRERRPTDFTPLSMLRSEPALDSFDQAPTVLLRRLPRHIGSDGIRNMLIFATDLVNVRLVESSPEDVGFSTAVAQFNTQAGAREVRDLLDGKTNATGDAQIIVEMPNGISPTESANARLANRRSTIDASANRTNGSAPDGSARQNSRFTSTFQSSDKISPPLINTNVPNSLPENSAHFQSLFSPTSPVVNPIGSDRQRNLGKSVINDDVVDDETDGLLRDPLAYARNGRSSNGTRSSMSQVPTAQFGSLSLGSSTFDGPSPLSSNSGVQSPVGGPQGLYPSKNGHSSPYGPAMPMNGPGRTSYPPANPADQNPPCNTLYVGNLPNNTSEDELKRLFSQQRGYKRLCFRTKQNGPMCFVEFENITLATQALHHLYGKMLSNSVKGGIRLSFSKNPLGVRNGQNGMIANMMGSHGGFGAIGGDIAPPPGFASNNGPPPGLSATGRSNSGFSNRNAPSEGMMPMYNAHQYSLSGAPFASQLRMPQSSLYSNEPSPQPGSHQFNGDGFYDSTAR